MKPGTRTRTFLLININSLTSTEGKKEVEVYQDLGNTNSKQQAQARSGGKELQPCKLTARRSPPSPRRAVVTQGRDPTSCLPVFLSSVQLSPAAQLTLAAGQAAGADSPGISCCHGGVSPEGTWEHQGPLAVLGSLPLSRIFHPLKAHPCLTFTTTHQTCPDLGP